MARTIRAKIAWLTGVLALAVLIGYGAFLYASLRAQLYHGVDLQLSARADELLATVQSADGPPRFAAASDPAALTRRGELVARLVSPTGEILDRLRSDLVASPLSLEGQGPGYHTLPFTEAEDEEEFLTDTETLRLLTVPVLTEGTLSGYLQVGRDMEPQQEALGRLLFLLLATGPILVGLASLGGYFLAGRALAPIERIRSQAASIHAKDLGRRLAPATTDDEVSRLAATFNQMLDRLQASFRRQRRFTADASHELRTPLAIIRGEIDVVLERLRTAPEYVQTLESIGEETQRMSRLVNELLLLARADADELPLEREAFDLAELLRLLVEQMAPQARKAGVTLKTELAPSLPLRGDRDRLLELFINLLENAFIHAPGSRVTVRAAVEERSVVVSVADTGPGIPEAHLPHLFERFYRIDPSGERSGAGSGLGLALAREIAAAHGGQITASSHMGHGSTFVVQLPGQPE